MKIHSTFCVLACSLLGSAQADILWTGAVSSNVFLETNWDLSNSTVTTVDSNVSVDDNIVVGPGANPAVIPNLTGQIRLQVADGYSIRVEGGKLTSADNDGLGGMPFTATGVDVLVTTGGEVDVFFITNGVRLDLDDTSSATLRGGATPVNGSTVNMTFGAVLSFTDEDVAAFTNEHLSKVSVDGISAVIGGNLNVVSDGAAGCIVTVIPSFVGSSYCGPAVPNTTGSAAGIVGLGSDLVADNSLELQASGMPQNQFALFLNSLTQGFVAQPGGSEGNLCLGGAIGRYNPAAGYPIQNTGSLGSIGLSLDLGSTPTPGGPVVILAGETWSFQCWYRDWIPGQGATSNFTDGLSVTWQ